MVCVMRLLYLGTHGSPSCKSSVSLPLAVHVLVRDAPTRPTVLARVPTRPRPSHASAVHVAARYWYLTNFTFLFSAPPWP